MNDVMPILPASDTDLAAEMSNRGVDLWRDGDRDGAYRLWCGALPRAPDNAVIMANLVMAMGHRREFLAAMTLQRRVVEIVPGDGVQWDRLASVYMRLDRFDEAQECVDRAVALSPDNPTIWHQAALLAHRLGQREKALSLANEALSLAPHSRPILHDRAHMMLALADLHHGFEEYEVRWQSLLHLAPWDLHLPEWKGSPLAGKRILMHSEQGLGDAIMLSRFARNLVVIGAAEVGLCLPIDLVRLYQAQQWPGVRVIDIEHIEVSEWDLHTPMFSALRWLGDLPDDIDPTKYLKAPPIIVPSPLRQEDESDLLVGICWASGKCNIDTALRRVAPLALFLELTEVRGVRLVSLQKGDDAADIQRLGAAPILFDPMPSIDNFAGTAALIAKLDAVVSVDTSVVHLAAAMGKPTLMLSQFTRCWRWWNKERGLPWYETMDIAQQTEPHDWRAPLQEAKTWLKARR